MEIKINTKEESVDELGMLIHLLQGIVNNRQRKRYKYNNEEKHYNTYEEQNTMPDSSGDSNQGLNNFSAMFSNEERNNQSSEVNNAMDENKKDDTNAHIELY